MIDTANETKRSPEIIRSNKDVLDIIFEADSTVPETKNSNDKFSSSKEKHNLHSSEKNSQKSLNVKPLKTNSSVISSHTNSNEDFNERMSNCIFCVKDIGEATLFNVVWCKRSGKKVIIFFKNQF